MIVTASPKFEFRFEIPLEAVVALAKVAEIHYDGVCKRAASADGFIDKWRRIITNGFPDITGTSTEFDISLKIMEQARFAMGVKVITKEEFELLNRLRDLFHRLFRKANEFYVLSRTEFEDEF